MTLQQLEYVVAVNTYRQFTRAAEACGVTQPTLSAQVLKLEEELGVPIFDRSSHNVALTAVGETLVRQAHETLQASQRLLATAQEAREHAQGVVRIGMCPSVAPFLMPPLVQRVRQSFPLVSVHCTERPRRDLLDMLQRNELDMTILTCDLSDTNILPIPLYSENLVAYLPTGHHLLVLDELTPQQLRSERLWCYPELLPLAFGPERPPRYEAFGQGSLFTLVALAEANGGVLIAPQTIIDILLSDHYNNLRPLVDPTPERTVHLCVRENFFMERLLNVVAQAICDIVPEPMLDNHLKKFGIRL